MITGTCAPLVAGTAHAAYLRELYVSVYLLRTDVRAAFEERLAGQDMGKGCLRFRKPENIDFDLVRDLLRATAARPGTVC